MSEWVWVNGVVAQGYRVASGLAEDTPYEDGSVKLQAPYFKKMGVDISGLYPGTVNVDISPVVPLSIQYSKTLEEVNWHKSIAPETFSFLPMQLKFKGKAVSGLLYYPHPDTKPGHIQPKSILEIIAPWIGDLHYGDTIEVAYPDGAMEMSR